MRFPLKALVTASALFLAMPGTPALAHGVEEGGWGEVPPWAYLAVVLAVVVSGLLLSARGAFRRQPARAYLRPASYRPLAAMCCLGAGAVHLLVAPEHFQEWWGYGCFFLVLATFQTLYKLLRLITDRIGGSTAGMHHRKHRRLAGIRIDKANVSLNIAEMIPVETSGVTHGVLSILADIYAFTLRIPPLVVCAGYGPSLYSVPDWIMLGKVL